MLFVVRLQSLQDLDRLFDTGFCDLDLLEAPRQGPVPLKIAAILVIGGRADAAQCAGSEGGLEDVRGVHRTTAGRARADDGVDLIDEQNGAGLFLEGVQHRFQALLELAAELGARQHRAHVEGVNRGVLQHVRHFAFRDP